MIKDSLNRDNLSLSNIFCNFRSVLMGNFEDRNMNSQITIFFLKIIISSFFRSLWIPIRNNYSWSSKCLSILWFCLERATTSSQQEENIIFFVLVIFRIEFKLVPIKVCCIKWPTASHIMLFMHWCDHSACSLRSNGYTEISYVAEFGRDKVLVASTFELVS